MFIAAVRQCPPTSLIALPLSDTERHTYSDTQHHSRTGLHMQKYKKTRQMSGSHGSLCRTGRHAQVNTRPASRTPADVAPSLQHQAAETAWHCFYRCRTDTPQHTATHRIHTVHAHNAHHTLDSTASQNCCLTCPLSPPPPRPPQRANRHSPPLLMCTRDRCC